jgi:hypothetical protein
VRGGLSRRDAKLVETHLRGCADCRDARAELAAVNASLRGVLAPVFLGGALAGSAASGAHSAATGGWLGSVARWLTAAIRHHRAIRMTAGLAITAVLVPAATVLPQRPAPPLGGTRPTRAGSGPGLGVSIPPTARTPSSARLPGGSPAARPTVGPSSAPPSPRPSLAHLLARLDVVVNVNGVLKLGLVAVVDVRVSDPGTAATKNLSLTLSMPAGISLLGLGPGSAGWSCSPGSGGATCAHGPLGAGAAATVSFRVLVVSLAGCGNPIVATAVSGNLRATGQSAAQVACPL